MDVRMSEHHQTTPVNLHIDDEATPLRGTRRGCRWRVGGVAVCLAILAFGMFSSLAEGMTTVLPPLAARRAAFASGSFSHKPGRSGTATAVRGAAGLDVGAHGSLSSLLPKMLRPSLVAKAFAARWARLTGSAPEPSKQWRAAGFFLQNFNDLSVAEMDQLIATTWSDRKLDEMAQVTGMNFSDRSLSIIDIGGGLTSATRLFDTPNKWVLDVCVDELRKGGAKFKPGVNYVNGSAHDVPFPDGFFDYVFCSNALDHFEDPALAISEMKRILKPNGHVIMVIDVFEPEYRRKPGTLHPHCFTRQEAEQLLSAQLGVKWSYCPPEAGKLGFGSRAKGLTTPKPGRREMSFVLSRQA